MSYRLTITPKATYRHAMVTGPNTRENVAGYLVQRECTVLNCFRLLIEERLDGPRLDTLTVFQIAAEGSRRAQGQFEAIAYVDVNAEGNLMKFAETVAVNRGMPVTVFSSVAEAEAWLAG